MAIRYQVLKNGVPVAVCFTPEKADEVYLEYGADEIVEIYDCNDEDKPERRS